MRCLPLPPKPLHSIAKVYMPPARPTCALKYTAKACIYCKRYFNDARGNASIPASSHSSSFSSFSFSLLRCAFLLLFFSFAHFCPQKLTVGLSSAATGKARRLLIESLILLSSTFDRYYNSSSRCCSHSPLPLYFSQPTRTPLSLPDYTKRRRRRKA